jgi:hypothetical protein
MPSLIWFFSAPPEHVSTYCVTIALTFIYCTTQSFLNAILIISSKLYMYVALYKIDSPSTLNAIADSLLSFSSVYFNTFL